MKQNLREAKSIFPSPQATGRRRRRRTRTRVQEAIEKVQQSHVSNLAVTCSRTGNEGRAHVRVLASRYVDPFPRSHGPSPPSSCPLLLAPHPLQPSHFHPLGVARRHGKSRAGPGASAHPGASTGQTGAARDRVRRCRHDRSGDKIAHGGGAGSRGEHGKGGVGEWVRGTGSQGGGRKI